MSRFAFYLSLLLTDFKFISSFLYVCTYLYIYRLFCFLQKGSILHIVRVNSFFLFTSLLSVESPPPHPYLKIIASKANMIVISHLPIVLLNCWCNKDFFSGSQYFHCHICNFCTGYSWVNTPSPTPTIKIRFCVCVCVYSRLRYLWWYIALETSRNYSCPNMV